MTLTTTFQRPENINLETMMPTISALRQEFKHSHGEKAFTDYYGAQFNENPSMQADTFNRSAHPFMIGLFMAVVLKKHKDLQDALIDGFTAEAKKPWDGQKQKFTNKMRDQILYDLQDTTDRFIEDDPKPEYPEAANDQYHTPPNTPPPGTEPVAA